MTYLFASNETMLNNKMIAINTNTLPPESIQLFIDNMSTALSSGRGSEPEINKALKLDGSAPLKFLLGMPADELTHGRRKFAEAVWSYTFASPLIDMPSIWTDTPNWKPVNPNQTRTDIQNSQLDMDFIKSFGLPLTVWGDHILLSSSLLQRISRDTVSGPDNLRSFAALAVFGFPEPNQFFRKR